jgi:hypothetical protein
MILAFITSGGALRNRVESQKCTQGGTHDRNRGFTIRAVRYGEGEAAEQIREARRLRIERWRVVYLVSDAEKSIDVLTVQKRPPYDYGDLSELIGEA